MSIHFHPNLLIKLAVINCLFRNIWVDLGRTEVIMDNLNPKFIKSFSVEYKFEERQRFKVCVYDVDDFDEKASLANHDFVGQVEFFLHEVVTTRE